MELSIETQKNILEERIHNIAKGLGISKEQAKEYINMTFDEQREYLEKTGKKFSSPKDNDFPIANSAYTFD